MLDEVAAAAGVSLGQVKRTCFGLAGLSIPAVRAWAAEVVSAQVAGSLELCGDEEIALDAAFRGGPGILVIAGTGSNAIGRAPDGRIHSAGGWGPILGDEGSGYWIGLEAVRAALHAQDVAPVGLAPDDPSTALLLEVQRTWSLGSAAELIELGNHRGDGRRGAPDFAALAPVVARCAEEGNELAGDILQHAGDELGDLVALVADKMGAGDGVSVAFTGSVLAHIAQVRTAMIARLMVAVPGVRVGESAIDPLEGALWRARHG
jgi:N-acetylglucosamine kinase-like BadF-type ATPase